MDLTNNPTLTDFCNMFFVAGDDNETMCYVFDNEMSFDSFAQGGNEEILFTVCSAMKAEFYLKECFSQARVVEFCALRQNTLCILIDADRKEALSL